MLKVTISNDNVQSFILCTFLKHQTCILWFYGPLCVVVKWTKQVLRESTDTFLNINAVWLQQFVGPGTPKTFLSHIPKKDFREKLCLDPPMISVINHEKQRGRSYQGLWWHLQVYWRMGSIPGKELLQKPNCPENCHIPRRNWSPWASSLDHI